jgi:GWxTD domain-containing protein
MKNVRRHLYTPLIAALALVPVISIAGRAAAQQTLLPALCDSARARLEGGDVAGARALYEQVLAREKDYPRAVIGLGMVLMETPNRTSQALEYFSRAVALDPTSPDAHFQKARAHLRLAQGDLGRGNANQARRELETVIALDPSHPEAYHLLGQLLMGIFHDYEQAADAFRKQTEAAPGNIDARFEYVKSLMDMGMFQPAVTQAEELKRRAPNDPRVHPYLAGAYWKLGRYDDSMQVFEEYFGVAAPEERDLFFDLEPILEADEAKGFRSLNAAGRRAFWDHYWSVRDPDPKTLVNERLLEHFIRVAWARIEFGQAVFPWDTRGDFYVRYGEPDVRSGKGRIVAWDLVDDDPNWIRQKRLFGEQMGLPSSMTTGMFDNQAFTAPFDIPKGLVVAIADSIWRELQMTSAGADARTTPDQVWEQALAEAERRALRGSMATPERWVYKDKGIDVNFDDPIGRGKYLVADDRSRMLVNQMETRLPTISEEEDKIQLIDPMDGVFTFRGADGRTAVEYTFALLPDEFGQFRSVTGIYATLDVDVRVYTPDWQEVARAGEQARRLQTIPQVKIRGIPLFVDATRLEVAPGEYRITTMLLDPVSGKRGTAEEEISLPDYSGSALMVSDILPAAAIREVPRGTPGQFVRDNLEVLPLPGRALQADQPLFIYYEVYNLKKDPVGATDYEISYAVGEATEQSGLGARLFQGMRSLVGAGRRRTVLTATVPRSDIRSDTGEYLEIGMSQLPAGTYLLELTVKDNLSGATASQRLLFRTLPARR